MSEIVIRGEAELLALHRALMELHFVEIPNDSAIIGSSFVARIANQTIEALIDLEESRGNHDRAGHWREWRRLDRTRREWGHLVQRLKGFEKFCELSADQKQDVVQCYASPFIVDVNALVAEVCGS